MSIQLSTNKEALRLFFNEDVYLIHEPELVTHPTDPVPPIQTIDKQPNEVNIPEKNAVQREFTFLGKNQKGILILVNDEQNDVSTEEGSALLRNIVKAISLTASDFAVVNYARYAEVQFAELNSYFTCKVILSFGVSAQQLGLQSQPLNTLIDVSGAQGIFSSNLKQLCADQQAKKALWGSLKLLSV